MSATPQTRLAFLASEVLRLSDSPLGRELAAHVQAYLARPTDLQPDLKRVRDKLARRLYSPENEADINALLEHLTAALAQLEGASVANCPESSPEHPPEHVPLVPDEWNRTHLKTEMARIRDNVKRWRMVGEPPGNQIWRRFLDDQEATLDVLARADSVIAAQAADLAAVRDGDYRDEVDTLRQKLESSQRMRDSWLSRANAAEQARLATERELQALRAEVEHLQSVALRATSELATARTEIQCLKDAHNAAREAGQES